MLGIFEMKLGLLLRCFQFLSLLWIMCCSINVFILLKKDNEIGIHVSNPVETNSGENFVLIFTHILSIIQDNNLSFTEECLKMVRRYQLDTANETDNSLLTSITLSDQYSKWTKLKSLYSKNSNDFKKLSDEFIQALLRHEKMRYPKSPYDLTIKCLLLGVIFSLILASITGHSAPIYIAGLFLIVFFVVWYKEFTVFSELTHSN